MTQIINYQQLYQAKELYSEMIQEEYDEFKETSQEYEQELENDVKTKDKLIEELKIKYEKLEENFTAFKKEMNLEERKMKQQFEQEQKQKDNLEKKSQQQTKKIIELENELDSIMSKYRMLEEEKSDLDTKNELNIEQLVLITTELDENKTQNQEDVERLKQSLKESQQDVNATEHRNQKKIKDLEEKIKNNAQGKNNKNLNLSIKKSISCGQTLSNTVTSPIKLTKNVSQDKKSMKQNVKKTQLKIHHVEYRNSLTIVEKLIIEIDGQMNKLLENRAKKIPRQAYQ